MPPLFLGVDMFDYQVLNLTSAFYTAYPNPPYTEILTKDARPYNCLLIQSHYDYFVCIPYRSQISHPYAFMFHRSKRSRRTKSGLDYTKIVIIKNSDYISSNGAIIDADEYVETRTYINTIKNDALAFVEDYVSYCNGTSSINEKEFQRRYNYSSLQYFHKELGIAEN